MNGLAEAYRTAVLAAGFFLVGPASLHALGGDTQAAEPGVESVTPLALSIPLNWLIAYRDQIIGFLMIAIAVLLIIYVRQQKEHSRHTRQLENLVSDRTQELERANADLRRLSITDPLTGMKNRRFVEFSITEDLARIRRSAQDAANEWGNPPEESAGISFLMIDIDFFKLVNDRYGHPAGDQVLRQMSALFTSMLRESDTTVRWGGEEFLIIARNSKANDTAILAERLRKRVSTYPFAISEEQTLRVTCSIGFASWPFFKNDPDAVGWESVIALADHGLYKAKHSGRNAWCGLIARPDYKGTIPAGAMNDPDAAEKRGIIVFQSSYGSIVGQHPPTQDMKPQEVVIPNDPPRDVIHLA